MATQQITIVILSKDLDDFKDIRAALNTDSRARLLSGGNDPEQVCACRAETHDVENKETTEDRDGKNGEDPGDGHDSVHGVSL